MSKTVGELQRYLATTKIPGKSKTYWKYFEEQLDLDGTWDEDFLDSVIEVFSGELNKYKKEDLSNLWQDSVSYKEFRGDKLNAPKEKMIAALSDELLDRVMDRLETEEFFGSSNYTASSSSSSKSGWDDESDDYNGEFEEFEAPDIIEDEGEDDEDFDDVVDDDDDY